MWVKCGFMQEGWQTATKQSVILSTQQQLKFATPSLPRVQYAPILVYTLHRAWLRASAPGQAPFPTNVSGKSTHMTARLLRITIIPLALSLLTGCDTLRLQAFATFAGLGSAYITAFHGLTRQAGSAQIATDSAVAIRARDAAGSANVAADAAAYRTQIKAADQDLTRYLANLQLLDAHATMLGNYFNAITAITDGKAADAISASADSMATSIGAFNPRIKDMKIAGKPVADFVKPATRLIVTHFAIKALNQRLERDAPIIDEALALQEAAVAALSAQLADALAASLQLQEMTAVIQPYVKDAPLPESWSRDREAYVRTRLSLESANGAKEAIRELHLAFRDLVENPAPNHDLHALIQAVQSMSTYVGELGAAHPSH